MAGYHAKIARIPNLTDLMIILAVGLGLTGLAHIGADIIAPWISLNAPQLAKFSLTSKFFWLIVIAVTIGLSLLSMMYGPQAAFFTELFSTEVRYSGATLGYQLGAIAGGAFAPTIAAKLWTDFDIFWVCLLYTSDAADE